MLKKRDEAGNVIEIRETWDKDDIIDRADDWDGGDNPITLTDKEISEVLEMLLSDHNANVGINWDVIDECIETVVAKRN